MFGFLIESKEGLLPEKSDPKTKDVLIVTEGPLSSSRFSPENSGGGGLG